MGIRETLNKNPAMTTLGTIAVIVIVLIAIILEMHSGPALKAVPYNFYTDDDGKTYFRADSHNIPPFDHDGKEAVRAYVYKTANGPPFVAYEEKYTEDAKAALDGTTPITPQNNPMTNKWVKVPEQDWVPKLSPEGASIVTGVRPPDGSDGPLQVVSP